MVCKGEHTAKYWKETAIEWKGLAKSLEAENERLKDTLLRIKKWANAYPFEIFPKPDLKKAARVLKDAGMTLDSISADNMRHVLSNVKKMVEGALDGK